MTRAGETLARVEVASRAELRAWLAKHHGQAEAVWLVSFKKAAGARYLPYDAIVEEALAFGWVDSLPRALDAQRSMHLIAPRKPGSAWSKVNKARVAKLLAERRMDPAGLTKVDAAKANGSWSKLDTVETLRVPPDLDKALRTAPPAKANFDRFPRSSKRLILEWIGAAKRPQTRADRIADTAAKAEQNLRANHARQLKVRNREDS